MRDDDIRFLQALLQPLPHPPAGSPMRDDDIRFLQTLLQPLPHPPASSPLYDDDIRRRLSTLAGLFLKLGTIGFGGLAVQLAMMEEEIVGRRRWMTRQQFLDIVGATNLIPGPNAVEVAIHVGYLRAGWLGFVISGICFIVPSAFITLGFAWMYVQFGALPQVAPLLEGIKPALLAVIIAAVWRLGKTAIKSRRFLAIGVIVLIAVFLGMNEIFAILFGGILGMVWLGIGSQRLRSPKEQGAAGLIWLATHMPGATPVLGSLVLAAPAGASLWELGWFFLRVGMFLYGSGYVLIAFLHGLVQPYGWLSERQLLEAAAIGQLTPGPFLSTATFIGYLILGVPGAAVATLAIFLPSFLFTALLNPIIPRLRRSPWTSAFLDAVNVSSIALMVAITIELAESSLTDWRAWLIAVVAAVVGLRWKINLSWLVFGGAIAGWLLSVVVS